MRNILDYIEQVKNMYEDTGSMAQGPRIGFKEGNGVYDEKDLLGKRVRELMDEGYEFGEAVRQAMKEGYAKGGRAGYNDGQLVTPSVDGSRPGYQGPKKGWKEEKAKFFKWLENNKDFDFANSSTPEIIKKSGTKFEVGTIQKFLNEEGIQTKHSIARAQDTPKYTKKVLEELREGLPKGISIEETRPGSGKYYYKIMLKGGKANKPTYRKSMVANEANKKLIIEDFNRVSKEYYPGRLTDQEFKDLRLKNKDMTTEQFAKFLDDEGKTTYLGDKWNKSSVSRLQNKLDIGVGTTGPLTIRTVDEAKKIIRQYPGAKFFFLGNPTDSEITQYASDLVSREKLSGKGGKKGFPIGGTKEGKMFRNFYDSSLKADGRMELLTDVPTDADGNIDWKMKDKNGVHVWKKAKFYDNKTGATYTWGKNYKPGDLRRQVDAAYGDGFFAKSVKTYDDQAKMNKMKFKGRSLNEWMREGLLQKELEVKLDRPLTNSKADKKLLKEFYALRKPSFSFTEAHHTEGVGKNPFRMEVSYRAANREQNNLLNKYKAGNLTKTEYATAMENLSDKKGGIRYKTDGRFIGTTGTQRSIATAAAKDAGLTKELRSLIIKLCPKGQASGGRIGYKAAGAVGGTLECGINQFNKNMKTGNANSSLMRRILANGGNILKSASKQLNPSELLRLRNLMGPQALGFFAAYEAGDITDDILRKNIPVNEALSKNWLTKTFLPYREAGAKAKNLLQSGKLTTDAQKKHALDLMKLDQAIIKQEQLEGMKSAQIAESGGYGMIDSSPIISNEMIDAAEKDLERRVSAIGDSVFTEGSAIGQEYQALENEMIASRLDKFKLPFQSDKGTPLVNKLARPSGRRIGPMTAKKEMKVDFSLPTYNRTNITEQDVLDMYKDEGWISPTDYKSGMKLRPGELTWWRMQNPGRGTYGTQEKFMGGGMVGIRKPHAIPPERQGLRSIMINVNDD